MRKKFRTRLSSVFLAMLMILSLLTISALAEENSYQEWSQSDALPASGSYRLMSDVTINEAPNITGSLVLDLNGRTVTLDGVGLNILKSGKLTLEDSAENGKIEITNSGRSGDRIVVSGTFTLSGGTIENQKTNVAAVLVNTTGSCTISGGTISNTAAGAKALMVSSGASVSVTGGTISSSVSGQTISINSAVFSMSGGYVKSACTAIYPMNSSTVTITGGTFMFDLKSRTPLEFTGQSCCTSRVINHGALNRSFFELNAQIFCLFCLLYTACHHPRCRCHYCQST